MSPHHFKKILGVSRRDYHKVSYEQWRDRLDERESYYYERAELLKTSNFMDLLVNVLSGLPNLDKMTIGPRSMDNYSLSEDYEKTGAVKVYPHTFPGKNPSQHPTAILKAVKKAGVQLRCLELHCLRPAFFDDRNVSQCDLELILARVKVLHLRLSFKIDFRLHDNAGYLAFTKFLASCKSVEELSLTVEHNGYDSRVSANFWQTLKSRRKCPHLRHLKVIGTSVRQATLYEILMSRPGLSKVDLAGCTMIDGSWNGLEDQLEHFFSDRGPYGVPTAILHRLDIEPFI